MFSKLLVVFVFFCACASQPNDRTLPDCPYGVLHPTTACVEENVDFGINLVAPNGYTYCLVNDQDAFPAIGSEDAEYYARNTTDWCGTSDLCDIYCAGWDLADTWTSLAHWWVACDPPSYTLVQENQLTCGSSS